MAEVLEDPRGRVLRDPRVVHDVDVVLAGLALAVLERLREERVVRRGQQLRLDPRLLLEERQDDLLERRDRTVLEGADHELALAGRVALRRGVRGQASEERRGGERRARGGR